MQLVAVSIGKPRPIPGMKAKTGIYKEPVTGPVFIDTLGIAEDAVLDRRHHGGRDQAVYVYFAEDYDFWETELGLRPPPGHFGENLTIAGTSSARTAIGDQFTIGACQLEVTYHRTPCMTFAAKMGDPRWVKRFHRANRPGAYCRVLTPGNVTAGDEVALTPYAGERITVSELMAYDGVKDIPLDFIRRAVTTPIREKTRFKYETRLQSLF
jgi:MOSC domain-containing protein YiiM